MSIGSVINNAVHSFKESLSNVFNKTQSSIGNIVGSASTGVNNIFNGGFVGMNEEGMDEVCLALKKYIDDLEAIIDSVTYYEKLESAYQGKVQETVIDYIESVKKLLRSYITRLNQEINEAREAYNNFVQTSQSVANNAQEDADQIRSESEKIKLWKEGSNDW